MVKNQTSIAFKSSVFLGVFLLSAFNIFSQVKEVVSVNVDKKCKKHIQKEFYKNESASTYVRLVFEMKRSANLHFEYKKNTSFIYIHCNDEMVINFHTEQMFLIVNNKEFILENAKDYRSKIDMVGSIRVKTIIYGYEMTETLNSELSKANSIAYQLIKKSNSKRSSWELSSKKVKNIAAKINCFNNHIAPEKNKYVIEQKKLQDAEIARQKEEKRIIAENEKKEFNRLKAKSIKDSITSLKNHKEIKDFEEVAEESRLEELLEYAKAVERGRRFGVLITQFKFSKDDYHRTQLSFGIKNYSNKKIKYAEFKVKATNPVNDQVGRVQKLKGIGFVHPYENADWIFESVWYEKTISNVSLLSIKLTFEDGSIKVVNKIGDIRDDMENNSDINSFDKDYSFQIIGPLSLRKYKVEYEKKNYEIAFFSTDHYLSIINISEEVMNNYIDDLSKAINTIKNHETKENGSFRVYNYSTNIYVYTSANQKVLINIDKAEELLIALKK